nr:reverse transcriptase domain-containing protein [Tanacetum cinerariifolium]
MLPVTQIDTFYNGLTLRHRDTINVAASRTFMKRRPEECYDLIKNMTTHLNDWDTFAQRSESSSSITSSSDLEILALKAEMTEINKNLMKVLQINQQDQVQAPSSQNTAPIQPSVIQSESQASVSEPVVAPVSALIPKLKPSIPYLSRRDNEKRHDQANEQIKKFYEIFKDMSFEISFTDALIMMPKFTSTLKALIGNKEKLSEMARTTM